MYHTGTETYELAQQQKAELALDEIQCKKGSRILDIGCGYGRILKIAQKRGVTAVGITISPEQQRRCAAKNLDVFLMNYKKIPTSWDGTFDGIVIYGALEHFVQPTKIDEQNQIYQNSFQICASLLKPGGKMFTAVIHFSDPSVFSKKQMQSVFKNFGGFYPQKGQLESAAQKYFTKNNESDGTDDYRRTSGFWLKKLKLSLSDPHHPCGEAS